MGGRGSADPFRSHLAHAHHMLCAPAGTHTLCALQVVRGVGAEGSGPAGGGRCMAAPEANAGPAPVVVGWPLPGCSPYSLKDLFSKRTVAELARAAGAAGGAVVLELAGHVLQAPVGGRPGLLYLLESGVPPAGLRSLALRNGTLALQPGWGLEFASRQPLDVCLERVKLTRPAPTSGSGAGGRRAHDSASSDMVTFQAEVSGFMRQCRVELSPAGPAGNSMRQVSVGFRVLEAGRRAGRRGGVPGGVPGGGVACRAAGWRVMSPVSPVSTLHPIFCPGGRERTGRRPRGAGGRGRGGPPGRGGQPDDSVPRER
jgi:hypothetical protein